MPVRFAEWFKREDLRASPDQLFVFGDNFAGIGFGGQAKECRGEPNAVGIATKRSPSRFLSDVDLAAWFKHNADAMDRIDKHGEAGGVIVLPLGGLGTGLAKLKEKAPRIYRELDSYLKLLEFRYGRV